MTRRPTPQLLQNLKWKLAAALAPLLITTSVLAQQPCAGGIHIDGTITDQTGALVPGAQVAAPGGQKAAADGSGRYVLCVPSDTTTLTVTADGFATNAVTISKQSGGPAHIDVQLQVARVETDVQVNADTATIDTDPRSRLLHPVQHRNSADGRRP